MKLTTILLPVLLCANLVRGQAPSANFTATPIAGCSPLVVQFTDQSTGSPTSWNWDFGNGNNSTLQNPSAVYFTPGNYTVRLTVTNAAGNNTLTRLQYISVYESPTVNFSGIPLSGCFPLHVQFTDLSTAGAGNTNTNWLWDFGNGATSSVQNPLITYGASGAFSVTLKVTNDKGCYKVLNKQNYINVTPGVHAGFINSASPVCHPPTPITFTNSSVGPGALTYTWNFGDGGTSTVSNPVHSYATAGTFTVTLVTTSSAGCTDSFSAPVTIINNTTAINGPDSVCVNSPVNFINASSPVPSAANWNFGDATTSTVINPTKTYSTPGTYTVRLINTYATCQDSAFKTIRILSRPVANFTAPVTLQCQPPFTVNFQDLSTAAVSWQWDFGDGGSSTLQNPSHTYNAYGSFDVKLTVTNSSGCTDSIIKTQFITVRRAQIAIPSLPVRGCIPYTINPIPTITAVDAVTSYFWDFGDGATSTLSNPSHTYPTQGTYTVKLFITTSTGCTDSLIIPNAVKVGSKPTANFNASPIPQCAYQPVQFTDQSTPMVDEWYWDFGDGGSSNNQNPAHPYTTTGPFTVTLVATNNGCPDTLVRSNYVVALPPIAAFATIPDCSNRFQFSFTDQSVGPVTWFWDFGDGTTSNVQNPVHLFPALGTYNVSLTVTNGSCSHTIMHTVKTIHEIPDFSVNTQLGCKSLTVVMTAQNVAYANMTNYSWSFDGVTFENTPSYSIPHTYNNSGTYTLTLITTDLNGCKDTVSKPNYVRVNGPVASFTATNVAGCKGLTTSFADHSTSDGVNAIVNWKWDFGDGTIQNFPAPPFQHTFNIPGTYSVKLTVQDASGCLDSIQLVNLVTASDPHALFTSPDTLSCPAATVNFINQSIAVNYTSKWYFGDGGNSLVQSPSHAYGAAGNYPVKLVITDQYGCADSLTKNAFIKVKSPVAAFSVNDSTSSCTPFEVRFTNTSQYYATEFWDFGTGTTSTLPNPSYYYFAPGIYNAKLIITSPGGCKDSVFKTITVYDTTGTRISYLPVGGCKPLLVNLAATTPGNVTYLWDFGDGDTQITATPNVSHLYTVYGNIVPKVIIQSNATCLIPVLGADTIQIIGAVAKFGSDKTLFCDSGRVNFIDSTSSNDPVTAYSWNFGDGGSSTAQQPFHQYNSPGIYNVSLAVQTQGGCRDTITKASLVKVVQSPIISIAGDSTVCIYGSMDHLGQFQIPDTSNVTWSWSFPNGNNSLAQHPSRQIYNSAGSFMVTTIATNSTGCKDTATKKLTIFPLPVVNMPGSMTTQVGFPITIPATYSPNTASYLWSPSSTLSCSTCPQPSANPKFNTNYKVSFIDSNGCKNTANITIVVICKNANVFVPNTFSPNGDGTNDVFYPRGQGINRAKSFRVFDRWGETIFESKDFPINDPNYGWDGSYKGSKAQPGVYVYQVEFYCDNGEIIRLEGNISLIL